MTRCDALLGSKCLFMSYTAFSTGEITKYRNTVLRFRYFGIGIIPIPSPFFARYRYPDTVLRYFRISGTIRFRYPSLLITRRVGLTTPPEACLGGMARTLLWTGTVCLRVFVELGFVWWNSKTKTVVIFCGGWLCFF